MAAGNEGNNFVRDGSMLPHHDIDTTTTPNSWVHKVKGVVNDNSHLIINAAGEIEFQQHSTHMYEKNHGPVNTVQVPHAVATLYDSRVAPEDGVYYYKSSVLPVLSGTPIIDGDFAAQLLLRKNSTLRHVQNMARSGLEHEVIQEQFVLKKGDTINAYISQLSNTTISWYAPISVTFHKISEAVL